MAASVTRVQTGVRLEARMLNVLKALAALKGASLGDLVEGIVLHAFEGRQPFSPQTLTQIGELKKIYGLDLTADDSHRLVEAERPTARATGKRPVAGAKRKRARS